MWDAIACFAESVMMTTKEVAERERQAFSRVAPSHGLGNKRWRADWTLFLWGRRISFCIIFICLKVVNGWHVAENYLINFPPIFTKMKFVFVFMSLINGRNGVTWQEEIVPAHYSSLLNITFYCKIKIYVRDFAKYGGNWLRHISVKDNCVIVIMIVNH